ncbi:beta-mannosidase [Chitinophaga vietnamensis]|uniref:beta-mannosidase n=1 Tax=Chitinophaga vietnamensis TaxID=2593957 RepID=UPI001178821A|nr:glycoside hydrolase family 2 protein [Chitinophaga vietnamensis]
MKYLLPGRALVVIFFLTCITKSIYAQTDTLNKGWEFSRTDENNWRSATVPGTVHTDLMAHQLIPDPFIGTNEKAVQWVDKKDWQYRRTLHINAAQLQQDVVELDFLGLDTYAKIYVNNRLAAQAANMFTEHIINIKSLLKAGDNELRIVFESPVKHDMPLFLRDSLIYPAGNDASDIPLSIYARKAPYHYGWDWGPRLVTSGIWRPVILRAWSKAMMRNIWIQQQQLDDSIAKMNAALTIEATTAGTYNVNIDVIDPWGLHNKITTTATLKPGNNHIDVPFKIEHPVRWWPRGMGQQNGYRVNVELAQNNEALAVGGYKVGLRTIEVVNKPDSAGESFYVKVNGQPVFMKGANYIPQDNFLPRVTRHTYQQLFDDMEESNFNMVRVWGGGIYEDNDFYSLADQKGILVWQDFMFACTLYPWDSSFLQNVKAEAEYNIRRLRNHPSLALWCGNNEIAVAIKNWGWQNGYAYTETQWQSMLQGYDKLFKELLPQAVTSNDPGRFYFHSSPISNWGKKEDFTKGDNHYWGVWHGMEWFEAFNTHIPRFMSEYGFQSFPDMETIRRFATPADEDIFSNVMQAHQKSPAKGNTAIKTYLLHYYKEPKDFSSFVYMSQVLQAEGMKMAIEAHRRAMPYCMGTLYWQLNDCWPGPSWSGRDYFGHWKALQYYVKKAFQPVILSNIIEADHLKTYIISDTILPIPTFKKPVNTLVLKAMDLSGKVFWKKELKDIDVKSNRSEVFSSIPVKEILQGRNPATVIFYTQLSNDNKETDRKLFYFAHAKEMQLAQPRLVLNVNAVDASTVEVTISTDKFARNVCLSLDKTLSGEHFEDNYFDLLPGEKRTVRLSTGRSAAAVKKGLKVTSLVDAYKR